jgi:transcriptional regulator with XRE-family HTH domain
MKPNWLKTYRKRLRISQEDLSAQLQIHGVEVTSGAISHWENGRYNPPLHDPMFRTALANVLRVSINEMLAAAGYETETATRSEAGERAAYIIDQLPPDKQKLALGVLERFLEND